MTMYQPRRAGLLPHMNRVEAAALAVLLACLGLWVGAVLLVLRWMS